jgi:hypothetical protein
MHAKASTEPFSPESGFPDSVLPSLAKAGQTSLATLGIVEIAGRQYASQLRLATMLGIATRTLTRWDAGRIGPPKIKVGKTILYDLAKLPDWLAAHETESVRAGRRR